MDFATGSPLEGNQLRFVDWMARWMVLLIDFAMRLPVLRIRKALATIQSLSSSSGAMIQSLSLPRLYAKQISRCTRAGGDNFRRCNLIPRSPRVNDRDSVFTSKFWSPRYHFRARLRLPPTRLLQRYQSSFQITFKTSYVWQIPFRRTLGVTCMDLAITRSSERFGSTAYTLRPIERGMLNLSPPDLVRFHA